ncbi:serine hydrolase family protein [Candidatus Woesearchaeota archaeon]|nr:serine hydrolase family protein [Candidatus Woesearchaeota archaeon]
MTAIFIIHGYGGYSKENWFPWLEQELVKLGHTVIVPDFPHPSNPKLEEWLEYFSQFPLDEDTIVVGHSLGGAFILSLLEQHKLKAAFLVAAVSGPIEHEVDAKIKTFTYKKFNWDAIKNNCKRFNILHSDNDPYIPLGQAQQLARNLDTTVALIKNGGHLNSKAGYVKFLLLLEKIKTIS